MNQKKYFFKIFTCLFGLAININTQAQIIDLKDTFKIKTIPYNLKIINDPLKIEVKEESVIIITSKEKTNLFNSPGDNYYVQNAPMLLFHPDSNFVISAKITADLKEVYDVAALVIYQDHDLWAKLCFENSVKKEATVVSVVTKKFSDDCNSVKIKNNYIYLSIAKKGSEFSFHCSTDNINWELVRHFRMECKDSTLMLGFAAHCSRGEKFSATFSDIIYTDNILENMRKYR